MKNNFTFDEQQHIYRLGKNIIPSVSEILQSVGYYNYIFSSNEAKDFGIAGHLMCKYWDNGTLNIATLGEDLVPYLMVYQKFLDAYQPEFLYIEEPMYSPKWKFGFTPDRIAYIQGKLTIYDLKFVSKIAPVVAIQLGAYKVGFEDFVKVKVQQRWAVQILEDGFKVYPYTDKRDEIAFLSALQVHYEKIRRGIWK